MLTIPNILNTPKFLDAPLDYKWDRKLSDYHAVDATNDKLGVALFALNHKSTFGIAAALSEWIYWRLSKHINIPEIVPILEAQWAANIDKRYSYLWEFRDAGKIDAEQRKAYNTIWVMFWILDTPKFAYFERRFFINLNIDKLAILARYISPDKKMFDAWYDNVFKRAAKLFPAQYDRSEIMENRSAYQGKTYDSSGESAIPREFFWDENFDYQTADNTRLINDFLSGLDYENNPYLNSSDKMLELGFKGTPYKYEPK